MSDNILIFGDEKPKVTQLKPKLISDFEQWKMDQKSFIIKPEDAWNYQQRKINLYEQVADQAAQTIANMKQIIEELKKFNEETMQMLTDLELENMQLKGEKIPDPVGAPDEE